MVIKIAGALAEQGKTMSEIVDICHSVRTHLRTIGLSASGVRTPGQHQAFEVNQHRICSFVSTRNQTLNFILVVRR